MINYNCEDSSLCENFQVAICLHCDRRLCVRHIIEHDKIVFGDVNKLSKLIEETLQQIKMKSEKSRIACDNLLPVLDEWRIQELDKIEQIYEHELQVIEIRKQVLEKFHRYLFEELERDARKPLERVQRQQNSNTVILNSSRQVVAKLRKESTKLKWDFSTLSSINTEYCPSEFPLTLTSVQIPMICKNYDKTIENIFFRFFFIQMILKNQLDTNKQRVKNFLPFLYLIMLKKYVKVIR
jgi:hypothetical protein